MRRDRRALLLALAAVLPLLGMGRGRIEESRHNLSVTGPGEVHSDSEDRVCVFCHIAHTDEEAPAPLWSAGQGAELAYEPYASSTLATRPGQPDGSSRLCLSCHDGTIAAPTDRYRPVPGSLRGAGASRSLGRAAPAPSLEVSTGPLDGTHPVSIPYDQALRRNTDRHVRTRLRAQVAAPDRRPLLDDRREVQCTSCHDPHADPAALGEDVPPFWRGDSFQEVCAACHDAPLRARDHADTAELPRGCGSCHVGHGVKGQPLLPAGEEEACYRCHGPDREVQARREEGVLGPRAEPVRMDDLFDRPYRHPVDETWGEHDPTEDPLSWGAGQRRHVECVDCHEIHGEPVSGAPKGWVPPAIRARVGENGEPEYELCYRCHSSNANLPFGQRDKAQDFNPANASYHPIEAPAKAADVPSLMTPWVHGDLMTCSDCHGPDGDDPREGPHGSRNPWILKGFYVVTDGTTESQRVYEACYDCHSRSSILGDESFPYHSLHVLEGRVSCYGCHDAHGSADYPGLIRFDLDPRYGLVEAATVKGWYRGDNPGYDPERGTCTLSCHGVEHVDAGGRR